MLVRLTETSLIAGKPGFPSLLLDGRRGFKLLEEEFVPEPRVACDFADPRSDVCELEGAIRIRGSTSEVFVVAPGGAGETPRSLFCRSLFGIVLYI